MDITTLAVHAGERQGAGDFTTVSTPIHNSTTFFYPQSERLDRVAGGEEAGFMYSRYANPTVAALEQALLALETGGAPAGAVSFAYGSGMAAIHAAVMAAGLRQGDRVLCSTEVYGATTALLMNVVAPLGLQLDLARPTDPPAWQAALARRPRLVLVEAISNPLLRVLDLAATARDAHAAGAKLLVDATFASPILCRPLALGADYVVQSTTKFIAGHGDAMGGVVTAAETEAPALFALRKLAGGVLGPFEAWLTLRGLKTLPLRVERQCQSALRLARELERWPAIERVHYPGLPSHADHAIAAAQFQGRFGGVLSFELRGARRKGVLAFMNRLRLCLGGTSLGDVQSLLLYPVMASHRDLSPAQRERIGIRENLVRLSVGLEDPADLLADLEQALAPAAGPVASAAPVAATR